MNNSIMSPEFMSGALRSRQKTNFLGGLTNPKPPAAAMARCARQDVHFTRLRTPPPPPPRARPAYGPATHISLCKYIMCIIMT